MIRAQVSYLDVSEPPDIVDDFTSSGERVRENSPLKLVCKARGNPTPKITWKREDGRDLNLNSRDELKGSPSFYLSQKSNGESNQLKNQIFPAIASDIDSIFIKNGFLFNAES